MELLILVVIALGVLVFFYTRHADKDGDGKVTVAEVKESLDVNKDGKVDIKDVKEVATKAKTAVKKTAAKAKTAVKKVAAKKPVAAKKTTK
jgi:Ca2+-binding EF-hand superfamily protein